MQRKHFRTKKVNLFWNFIKNKFKVTLGIFLNFLYDSSYLWTKKVHGYLISFEPQMVRSSYNDHLCKLKYRFSIGLVIRKLDDNYLESSRQDLKFFLFICYKQLKNDEPVNLNFSCKIIREYLYAIFGLSKNSSKRSKFQILFMDCKIYSRWLF